LASHAADHLIIAITLIIATLPVHQMTMVN